VQSIVFDPVCALETNPPPPGVDVAQFVGVTFGKDERYCVFRFRREFVSGRCRTRARVGPI
jgi:hypothetical protein